MNREAKRARALELRAEGLTYAAIGEVLGCAAYKLIHPDRAKRYAAAAESKPGRAAQKRAWENQHDRDPCPRCGKLRGVGAKRAGCTLCQDCRFADRAATKKQRDDQIVAMWLSGLLLREIADALGTTKESIGVSIVEMRNAGRDVPYRYRKQRRKVAA